jgi:hypothetical protein
MISLGAQLSIGELRKIASIAVWMVAVAAFSLGPQAGGQAAGRVGGGEDSGARELVRHLVDDSAPGSKAGEVVREIDDVHTGARWLLLRNSLHPERPGRLVMAALGRDWQAGAVFTGLGGTGLAEVVPPPVAIRRGDALIVEEHTAIADAALEAVALGPAAVGSALEVRLKIGGKVLRAVAISPGRALLHDGAQNEVEVWP